MYQSQVAPQAPPVQGYAPVVVQQSQTNSGIRPGYASKSSAILGALQLAIGGFCIVFQIAAIVIDATAAFIGTGIWAAVPMIVAGILGLAAAKSKAVCTIVGVMVMSIIASVFAFILLITSAVGLGIDNDPYYNYNYGYDYNYSYDTGTDAMKAMNAILIILAFVEIIVSIWASAICCSAACCGDKGPRQGVILGANQTVAYTTSGQVVMITGGAMVNGNQVMYAQLQPGQPQPGQPQLGQPQPGGQQPMYGAPMQPPAYTGPQPPTYQPQVPGNSTGFSASAPPPPAYSYGDDRPQKM